MDRVLTAIAGPDASTSAVSKKKVKKIAKKQAIKQINALAPSLADEQIDRRAAGLSVARAENAGSATNAGALQGKPASAFASSKSEPYREVGAPGQPVFQNGWINSNPAGGASTAAFYKDPLGVVHLKGSIFRNPGGVVAFTLPPGYRPSQRLHLPMTDFGLSGESLLTIEPDGDVTPSCSGGAECEPGIDGLTFRAQ